MIKNCFRQRPQHGHLSNGVMMVPAWWRSTVPGATGTDLRASRLRGQWMGNGAYLE